MGPMNYAVHRIENTEIPSTLISYKNRRTLTTWSNFWWRNGTYKYNTNLDGTHHVPPSSGASRCQYCARWCPPPARASWTGSGTLQPWSRTISSFPSWGSMNKRFALYKRERLVLFGGTVALLLPAEQAMSRMAFSNASWFGSMSEILNSSFSLSTS